LDGIARGAKMRVQIGNYPKSSSKVGRKIKIHIDPWDIYNVDHTISLVLAPLLRRFREHTSSYPSHLDEKEWKEILDKMIWSFDQVAADELSTCSDLKFLRQVEEGLELFAKWFQHLWF
jgi:hypothetical protein